MVKDLGEILFLSKGYRVRYNYHDSDDRQKGTVIHKVNKLKGGPYYESSIWLPNMIYPSYCLGFEDSQHITEKDFLQDLVLMSKGFAWFGHYRSDKGYRTNPSAPKAVQLRNPFSNLKEITPFLEFLKTIGCNKLTRLSQDLLYSRNGALTWSVDLFHKVRVNQIITYLETRLELLKSSHTKINNDWRLKVLEIMESESSSKIFRLIQLIYMTSQARFITDNSHFNDELVLETKSTLNRFSHEEVVIIIEGYMTKLLSSLVNSNDPELQRVQILTRDFLGTQNVKTLFYNLVHLFIFLNVEGKYYEDPTLRNLKDDKPIIFSITV